MAIISYLTEIINFYGRKVLCSIMDKVSVISV